MFDTLSNDDTAKIYKYHIRRVLGTAFKLITTQQTTTHDFSCSVSEFTSSTGSIHMFLYMNLPDSVNKFGVSTRVYREITGFSCIEYNSCQSRSELMTTGRTHVFK